MVSNVKKGNYYKYKTKKYLVDRGYVVEYSEMYLSKGKFMVKKDLFHSDLIAVRHDRVLFVQSKVNKKNLADARKNFKTLQLPANVYKVIAIWEPRVRKPIMEVVE